jgi:hypothetical protein
VALGHSQAQITEVYAERDLALAAKVAQQIGRLTRAGLHRGGRSVRVRGNYNHSRPSVKRGVMNRAPTWTATAIRISVAEADPGGPDGKGNVPMPKHRKRTAGSLADLTPEEKTIITKLRELTSHPPLDCSALFPEQEKQPERLEPLTINLPPNAIWSSGITMVIEVAASLADLVEKGVRTGELAERKRLSPKKRNTQRDADIIRLWKEDPRKWSRKKLAKHFEVSTGAIKEVLYRARKEGKLPP